MQLFISPKGEINFGLRRESPLSYVKKYLTRVIRGICRLDPVKKRKFAKTQRRGGKKKKGRKKEEEEEKRRRGALVVLSFSS